MHKFLLIILLACCFVVQPAWSSDEDISETEETCDADSDEACAEEELERGFDPCLINARLPACKKNDQDNEAASPSRAEESEDSDDSG